jgi:hypothetical protein
MLKIILDIFLFFYFCFICYKFCKEYLYDKHILLKEGETYVLSVRQNELPFIVGPKQNNDFDFVCCLTNIRPGFANQTKVLTFYCININTNLYCRESLVFDKFLNTNYCLTFMNNDCSLFYRLYIRKF